ncbi:apolipoprotein N-acyltransferase [Thermodesulfobacteriota bacterium]
MELKTNSTMKSVENKSEFRFTKILLAILSGIILTASFPPGAFSFMAWIALIPLFLSLDKKSFAVSFKLGLIAGLTHYLTLIYWIMVVLGHYGNLSIIASLGPYIMLCFYLALFLAIFSALSRSVISSTFGFLWVPGFWVSLEYVRSNLMSGLPWCLLGYSQYKHLPVIQVADIVGVYGISFLIVFVNVYLFRLIRVHSKNKFYKLGLETGLTILLVSSTLIYGYFRISEMGNTENSSRSLKIVIAQGNIDQSLKWEPSYQKQTMEIYERLSRSMLSYNPDMIIWPETAVPFFFQNNRTFSPRIFSLAKESGAVIIFGSPAYTNVKGLTRYYNRAYLVSPQNLPVQYYDKVHLVPFGEYVPLKNVFSFINRLVPAAGDFRAGKEVRPFSHSGLGIGVLICFECIFPELAREHTLKGARILVNLTNDAWFGKTSAPHQHLSMAVFRAVENRRPLLRSANTGISAFIEPQGRIVSKSRIFEEAVLYSSVHPKGRLTLYTLYGDVFVIFLSILSFLKIVIMRFSSDTPEFIQFGDIGSP